MIHIPLSNHNPGKFGSPTLRGVQVELDDDGAVRLSVDGEDKDNNDDVDRSLLVDEARALAAALWHFAGEAGR